MNLQRSQPPVLQQVPVENVAAVPRPASHGPAPGATEQPFLRFDIVRALELHRNLALGFALAGLLLAVAYAVYAWPKYVAQSQIYIQPTSAKILDQGNNSQRWPYDSNSYDSFIQQQVQLASNPDVLVNALHKLPGGSWQRANENEQQAAERLGGVLKVERLGSSYQVAITAQARSAEMAAEVANAVANSIVEKAGHEANAGDTQRLTILDGERDRVQNQLNADLAEQNGLNKQLGMAAVGTEAPDLIDNAIGTTRNELIKARTDHDEAEARFESLGAGKSTSSAALDAEADELIASDAGLTSMKTSLNSRRATLITQMANLTPNNPEYKLDAEELSKINSSLDAMMADLRGKAAARIQQKLKTDLERTSAVETQLNGQLRQLADTAASATPKLQRANDLATDIVRLRSRYAAVDEALHDIQLQDSVPGAVHLSVAAVPPLHPSLAGILRKSVPLAFGGILLGLLAALLANQLDPRIYIASDIERLLGFAPMIALPDCDEVPDAVFEEHILRLSTAIEHARKQSSLRTCIFTGCGTGTGVTTVLTRVRNMLSSMGTPTVLVNATGTAQPAARSVSAQNIEPSPDESGIRSLALLQRVTHGSGTQDESLVLTDTAPLLISAETEYLARFVDCAIVVAQSGATTRAELRATADALQRLNVSAVGLVLNRVRLEKADAAFRNSIRGVEAHIRLQGRSNQKAAPRPRHFVEEIPPAMATKETVGPIVRQQSAVERDQEPALNPEPVLVAQQEIVEPEQPIASTEPAALPQALIHQPATRAQPVEEPISSALDEQPKIAPDESGQGRADRVAEGGLIAKQPENEQIAADCGTLAKASQHLAIPEYAVEETILPDPAVTPQSTGQSESRVPIQEQSRPHNQHHVASEYGAMPEYTRSEYARSEYPVFVPEPENSQSTAPDYFAEHNTEPVASALDPNLPWWLSEAPLTTAEFAAQVPQGSVAAQQERPPRPASDEPVRLPASRLSGLRNVIFGTGSRDLDRREVEKPKFEDRCELVFDQQAESPIDPALNEIRPAGEVQPPYEVPPLREAPAPAPLSFEGLPHRVEPAASVLEVVDALVYAQLPQAVRLGADPEQTFVADEVPQTIAMPEILPPQPISASRNRTDLWGGEPKRLDRGDTIDDIPLLPSRRGQYRRKI